MEDEVPEAEEEKDDTSPDSPEDEVSDSVKDDVKVSKFERGEPKKSNWKWLTNPICLPATNHSTGNR